MRLLSIKLSGLGVLLLIGFCLTYLPAQAAPLAVTVNINLCASDGAITLPDSTVVTVWGFVNTGGGPCTSGLLTTLPGPEIRVNAGDTVNINLTNALDAATSLVIPGQTLAISGGVAGTFAQEAAANGGTVSYGFTAVRGSYLYESNTDPGIQVAMGLYGALVVQSIAAPYNNLNAESVLVLSEIDPALNGNPSGFNLLHYHPRYFLINGKAYPSTAAIAVNPGDRLLLRYLNAGFDDYSMALLGAHQRVIAKNGFVLPNAFSVVAETVPSGATMDTIVTVSAGAGGTALPLYNRNMYLTNNGNGPGGMRTTLQVSTAPPPPPANKIYVSSSSNGTVGGMAFADEDILVYESGANTWAMVLDLSDVSVTTDVDAFAFTNDGNSVLVSFDAPIADFPGSLGAVDDSDILLFTPTSWGATTAGGSFTMYFDGSDVGLTTDAEDIDALHRLADGRLIISTLGAVAVTGVSGNDEDLLLFTFTGAPGAATNGGWSLHFDGSDVGLTDGPEDIWGVWSEEPPSGDLYLSTTGNFAVTGVSGDDDDIFICTPSALGAATNCDFSAFWNGGAVGFGPEQLDGISVNDGPAIVLAAGLQQADDASTQNEPDNEVQEDIDDTNEESQAEPIYLPMIQN